MVQELLEHSAVKSIAGQLNLDHGATTNLFSEILPQLQSAIRDNATSGEGLSSLSSALDGGSHDRYLDDPDQVVSTAGTEEGNKILGHVLGSKDKSREVAQAAAEKTGVDYGIIKKFLPMAATLAMGQLKKHTGASISEDTVKSLLNKLL